MTVLPSQRFLIPLVFLLTFIAFYFSAYPLLDDNDVPWHLAAGKLMWETHRLPTENTWSFAARGTPWYLLSWLWDGVIGGVEYLAGAFGVYLFTMALSAGIVALLAGHLLARGIAVPAVLLTVLLAALGMMEFAMARPQLAGYALALLFYMRLYAGRKNSQARLWPLPLLMLVWANSHGSFIVGFTILGAFIVEAWFAGRKDWLRRLILIAIACGITALLNPYGPEIALGAMRSLHSAAKQYIVEWLPYVFTISPGISSWLLAFILFSNIRLRMIPLADKLLAFAWLTVTLFSMRNGAFFILLSAPYLAMCMDEQTRDLRKPLTLPDQPLKRMWAASLGMLAVFIGAMAALPHEDRLQSPQHSAADAVAFAQAHYPKARFLTDYNYGGQVIYRSQGRLPVFIDSRAGTAYSEALLEDYIDFLWLKEGWQERLKPYRLDGMIIGKEMRFASAYDRGQFHDRWKLVFAGSAVNVYIATQ